MESMYSIRSITNHCSNSVRHATRRGGPPHLPSALFIVVASLASACGSGGGGDEGAGETGNDPTPIDGVLCGDVNGFETRCWHTGSQLKVGSSGNINLAKTISNPVQSPVPDELPAKACCQGLATEAAADTACVDLCQRQLCEIAQSNHLDMANGIEGLHVCASSETCGFSMSECLSGQWTQQKIEFLVNTFTYHLQATCSGVGTNEVFTDGVFDWNEQGGTGGNNPANDPDSCDPSDDIKKDPRVVIADDLAIEDAGTTASVSWTMGTSSGVDESLDAEVAVAYDVHDCPTNARCLDLAKLELTLPSTTVHGLVLSNMHMEVQRVDVKPTVGTAGGFNYPAGTLHARLSGLISGVPMVLAGTNAATVTGTLSPQADVMTLSGLRFDYSDSGIAAQLEIDIVGDYTERGPTAVIVPMNVPRACTQAVTFRAATSDPDGGTFTHVWWVPGSQMATGSTISLVLPAGQHRLALISRDNTGHLDATGILYNRSCQ